MVTALWRPPQVERVFNHDAFALLSTSLFLQERPERLELEKPQLRAGKKPEGIYLHSKITVENKMMQLV